MTNVDLKPSEQQLAEWNKELDDKAPEEIVEWAVKNLPHLYQTTAFGLSGLCILDMMKHLGKDGKLPVELVFIDTLYHFPQTLELVEKVRQKYDGVVVHVYQPSGCKTEAEFKEKYGDELWEKDQLKYDFLVKVEPLERAYQDLGIGAVFTGRRRSQGAARAGLPVVEYDSTMGVVKVNPLVNWGFDDVKKYIDANDVPYNDLLDLGYKSIGDWHSTSPVKEGEDERAGRWKGQAKTECGIHVASNYKQFLDNEGTA